MRSRLSTSFAALSIVGRWPTPNVILSEDFASRSAKQNRSRRIPARQLRRGNCSTKRLPSSQSSVQSSAHKVHPEKSSSHESTAYESHLHPTLQHPPDAPPRQLSPSPPSPSWD